MIIPQININIVDISLSVESSDKKKYAMHQFLPSVMLLANSLYDQNNIQMLLKPFQLFRNTFQCSETQTEYVTVK